MQCSLNCEWKLRIGEYRENLDRCTDGYVKVYIQVKYMLLQKSGGIKVIKKIRDTFLKVFKNIFVCYQQFVLCIRARKRSTSMTSTTTSSAVVFFFKLWKQLNKTWSFGLFYSQEKTLHQPSIVPGRDWFFSSKVWYLLHSQVKYLLHSQVKYSLGGSLHFALC